MDSAKILDLAQDIDEDLGRQIEFLLELDKLKSIIRRNWLIDGSRLENTAEHSWHLAMIALVLAPRADVAVDLSRAVAMLLVHDVVEIDAGDTYAYDPVGQEDKEEREQAAAARIFGLLPEEAGVDLRQLWEEFERRESPTAVFAYACDRLQPMLLNAANNGTSWMENDIRRSQVVAFNHPIDEGSADLWRLVEQVIDASVDDGILGAG